MAIKKIKRERRPGAPVTPSGSFRPSPTEGGGSGTPHMEGAPITPKETMSFSFNVETDRRSEFLAEAYQLSTVNHPNCLQRECGCRGVG